MVYKIREIRVLLAFILVLFGGMMLGTPVFAAGTINVNTFADENNTGDSCSLREAIKAANTDAAFGGCTAGSGTDTITLPMGTYTLSLGDQLPPVTTDILIDGNESIIQADVDPDTATWRVFEVTGGGDLTLKDLTVRHGHCVNALSCASQSNPDNDKGNGGGIFNNGILTLNNVDINKNSADNGGGGIYHKSGTLTVLAGSNPSNFQENSANSSGGGIGSGGSGAISMTQTIFLGNTAGNAGGAISSNSSDLDVTGSTFSANSAGTGNGSGGAISSNGNSHIKTSSFHDNSSNRGGGLFNGGGSTSFVANSTFYSNTATSSGGGIYNYDNLAVINSTLYSNTAATHGGAFYSNPYQHQNDSVFAMVTLSNTILANSAGGVDDCYNYVNGTPIPITGSNNLIQTDSAAPNECSTTDPINNADPMLGALTGSPGYNPLLVGSPAIDMGDDTVCAAAPINNTSQNGVVRPQGLHCDIGAVEMSAQTVSTTTLTSTPNPSVVDQLVVFVATVSGSDSTQTASTMLGASVSAVECTGTVTFLEGATTLGTEQLNESGIATLILTTLTAGTHSVTAQYEGDQVCNSSTSTAITQNVNSASGTMNYYIPQLTKMP